MNEDLDLLASAYLDGDLDDAARADAERDPAVAARVAQLRAVRDAVAAVEPADPPPAATRDRLLAAALAAYDELHATPDAAAATVVAHAPPRPARANRSRWLGAVAAATVVAAGIGVVVASVGTDDDEDSAGISDAAVVVTDDGSDARVQEETAPGAPADAAGSAESAESPDDPTAATLAAADTMMEATEGSAAAAGGGAPDSVPVSVVGTGELATFVEQLVDVPSPDPDAFDCADVRYVRLVVPILYAPDASTPQRGAVVALDATGTTAAALDLDTCEVLAEVAVDRQD